MSGADLAVAAVAVACFYSLWWCLSLARRLRRIERSSKLDPLTGLGSGDWLQAERWPAALRSIVNPVLDLITLWGNRRH